jgi:hypothetical protein
MGFLCQTPTQLGGNLWEVVYPFTRTVTLTSAAAATAVSIFADADVPRGCVPYITHFTLKVNGGTLWGTVATVTIEDTAGVDFATIAVAALAANAFLGPFSTNVTIAGPMAIQSGGTVDKGLQIKADVNGTGSDLVAVIHGYYRKTVKV